MTVGKFSHPVSWKVGFVFVYYETNMMTGKPIIKSDTGGDCHGCLQSELTLPPVGGDWNWRLGDSVKDKIENKLPTAAVLSLVKV